MRVELTASKKELEQIVPGMVQAHGVDTTPSEVKSVLDEEVIGQEQAKRVLSVAAHNRELRRLNAAQGHDMQLDKPNVMMIGPTGCGKTLLIKQLAKAIDAPLVQADASELTAAGWKGKDVDTVLKELAHEARSMAGERASTASKARAMTKDIAEYGIVFIDEIDKISERGGDNDGPGRREVQESLLKMIEGTTVHFQSANGESKPPIDSLDTTNVLFVMAGAYPGLNEIIRYRLTPETSIGFGGTIEEDVSSASNDYIMSQVRASDLVSYGIIHEFIGRVPLIANIHQLTRGDMLNILKQPKSSVVNQLKHQYQLMGHELELDDDLLLDIIDDAIQQGTGARSLRNAIESIMLPHHFSAPDQEPQTYYIKYRNQTGATPEDSSVDDVDKEAQ